jgi:hypothetical protein
MKNNTISSAQLSTTELDSFILRNAEELAFPPSEWEADTLAEVLALPRVVVTRPPDEDLFVIGMRPNDCHSNCAAQVANDPEGRSRHVSGWYIHGTSLILHSVVEIGSQWVCLTPQIVKTSSRFQFIPDALITWQNTSDGKARDAFRCGRKLPQALRKYPELHIQMRDEFNLLIALGMSAVDARERVDATLSAELRKMTRI